MNTSKEVERVTCGSPSARMPKRIAAGVLFAFAAAVGAARAENPVAVQTYYVPITEPQILQAMQTINPSGTLSVNPVQTYISVSAVADGTVIYYDQWENGFDADISNPANLYGAGNPGGTQIWGDGNPANGAPPGVPADLIDAGTVFILNNPVTTTNMQAIDFDGGDKIASSKTIAVARAGWSTGPNTLLAGANEVFDTASWGTSYRLPVGANLATSFDYDKFSYAGFSVMAAQTGTIVQIDKDANGTYETSVTLNEGQSHLVNGGVQVGARIQSNLPVQVDMITGDIDDDYECDFHRLLPNNLWSSSYYTPVSTSTSSAGTTVWLYNPTASSITVQYQTRTGTGGNTLTTTALTVPGGTNGGYLKQVIPNGYGARFYNT
ncbi:MAG: IgGFc-binding protein, partial [Kiritimatiellae bacterium]|nr:IgGFc-binding protein [Kiritimatiellia bacterium]